MATEVEIFGQAYVLRADADEEHVRKVADLVDSKMREVAAVTRSVSTIQIAVLAALDIASELLQGQTASERFATLMEAQSESLVRRIDSVIPEVLVP